MERKISGVARHQMINSGTKRAIFDIKGLKILKVTTGDVNNETNRKYEIGKETNNKILGKPLNGSIAIGNNVNSNHKSLFM